MLPFLAFLGHNAVYLLAGFLCFCWLRDEEDEEEPLVYRRAQTGQVGLANRPIKPLWHLSDDWFQ
jgi:hypothetical protein